MRDFFLERDPDDTVEFDPIGDVPSTDRALRGDTHPPRSPAVVLYVMAAAVIALLVGCWILARGIS